MREAIAAGSAGRAGGLFLTLAIGATLLAFDAVGYVVMRSRYVVDAGTRGELTFRR